MALTTSECGGGGGDGGGGDDDDDDDDDCLFVGCLTPKQHASIPGMDLFRQFYVLLH